MARAWNARKMECVYRITPSDQQDKKRESTVGGEEAKPPEQEKRKEHT